MKALILAAGRGYRLKKITSNKPKPMLMYRGKPILEYNIELCKKYGINEVYINVHYLPDLIRNHFYNGENWGIKIHYSFEKELLGTSGALKKLRKEFTSEPFYVVYGDNYTNYNLQLLKEKSDQYSAIVVIGFHWREDTKSSGVAEFSENGRIKGFIEKPKQGESKSHWVNAGIYYLRPEILKYIPFGFSDFSNDIFPKLLYLKHDIYGVCSAANVAAFDTPEMYKESITL